MRRIVVEEPQTTQPRLSLPTEEQAPNQVEQESSPIATVAKKKPGRPRISLRWAIIVFGSIGIFSLAIPPLTGMPLSEWLQGADFKAAYGGQNFAYMRGTAALKLGNLGAATSALYSLKPQSQEADDLASDLFPKTIAAKDFDSALRIYHFFGTDDLALASGVSPAAIGTEMGKTLKLAPSLELLKKSTLSAPERLAVQKALFDAVGSTELPALVALVPTLQTEENIAATKSVANAYAISNQLEEAWRWTESLPETVRAQFQASLITTNVNTDASWAAQKADLLPKTVAMDEVRGDIARRAANTDPKHAEYIASKMTPGKSKTQHLAHIAQLAAREKGLLQSLERIEQIQSPTERANVLVGLAAHNASQFNMGLKILPKVAALIPGEPALEKTHDELAKYLALVNASPASRETYIAQIRDPEVRAALKRDLEAGNSVKATLNWGTGTATSQSSNNGNSYSISGGVDIPQSTAPGKAR